MERELKKLNRRELVDVIYQMKKNEQQMQEETAALKEALEEKRIRISVAGSIAEAAVDVTKILSTAQATADLYLQEIACMKKETEETCAKMIADAEQKVAAILSEGEQKFLVLAQRYKADYQKWQQLQMKLQDAEKPKEEI